MLFVRDFLTGQVVRRAPATGPAPLVSVILPTFRRCQTGQLSRAVESVLRQTFADLELIVMDDGSTDGSADLIQAFQARDPRVVHVRHERNSGLHILRVNEGIELARGQFIALQFDDDLWRPQALEILMATMKRQLETCVVYGQARFHSPAGREWVLPAGEISFATLLDHNQIANNSVLFPKNLTEQYGLHDPHIGMRRLSDWDLWLRYIKHVPFINSGEIIADVYESNPGSIGTTVPWDLALFRFLHAIPRDHLLTPGRWRDYEVDSVRIGAVEFAHDFRRRVYEEQIVPYYFRFRHYFRSLEGFSATLPNSCQTLALTKNSYDVSNEVTLNNYDALSSKRGNFKAYFQPLGEIGPEWLEEADGLLLVRTVEDRAKPLLEQALENGKPIGLYLDDDLLHFHEYGPQFDYLRPDTPYHRNLSQLAAAVDTVWVTNQFLEASIRPLNPRTVPHNNCVPAAWLPAMVRSRAAAGPIRIGYTGNNYRLEEFTRLWPAFERISQEYSHRLIFEFWGLEVNSLPRLASPVIQKPFTFSYFNYLQRLQEAEFDILLAPLLDYPRPRLAKSSIKYSEAAVAGALGIFSDVPQYQALPAGLTCVKARNTADDWYLALREALDMPLERFNQMRCRALAHVREEFTEAAQIHKHEAAWRATEFHARTRSARHADGRPRVLYALHSAHFGGGEIQLWRRLRLARQYGIEPVIALPQAVQQTEAALRLTENLAHENIRAEFVHYTCFDRPYSPAEYHSDLERAQVRKLLQHYMPALVHSVTYIPTIGQICAEMGIPHIASIYAVEDTVAWPTGRPDFAHANLVQSDSRRYADRWGQLLGIERVCAREIAPQDVFDLGQRRHLERLGQPLADLPQQPRLIVTGTLQPRKRQREIIEAVGRLHQEGHKCHLEIYGYTHFFPEYLDQCRENARIYQLEDYVHFHPFSEDIAGALAKSDLALSLSTYESFPSAIKEAMAAGVLVVATPVGGVEELILDQVTGILCADPGVEAITAGLRRALTLSPDERHRIVEQARCVARSEFHPQRAANDLLSMYCRALQLNAGQAQLGAQPARRPPTSRSQALLGLVEAPTRPPANYVPLWFGLSYRLAPNRQNWMGLDLLLGTHQRPPSGRLRLRILEANGRPLREMGVDIGDIRDNDWLSFRFTPILNSLGMEFKVELSLTASSPETRVSVFEDNAPESAWRSFLRRCRLPLPGNTLYCRMWYSAQL